MKTPDIYLLAPEKLVCLGQDYYVSQLAGWVLDNNEHSGLVQEKIIEFSDLISLRGYEILWQKLRFLDGWEKTLWKGISGRKHPTQDCIDLVSKNNGVQSMADMYSWLYASLSERSHYSALLLSQSLALQAANFALCGIWTGADLLMRRIVSNHGGKEILIEGKYNWWEAAAIVLSENMEKQEMTNNSFMRSGLLREPVLAFISILEEHNHTAQKNTVNCGQIFYQAVELDDYTYLPILDAWVGADGDWRGLWDSGNEQIRSVLGRHPAVRKARLMERLPDRFRDNIEYQHREI